MTTLAFCTEQSVRDYIELNGASTSKISSASLASNIRAASQYLEQTTHRWFGDRVAQTWTTSTNGMPYVQIPGFRTFTSVTLNSAALSANSTYYPIPDRQNTGIYVGLQFQPFNTGPEWWKSVPDWFDKGLDSGRYGPSGIPNDLVIVGNAGYADADLPEQLRHACKILAAWYTLRPSGLITAPWTAEGTIPIEVKAFIQEWNLGQEVMLVG